MKRLLLVLVAAGSLVACETPGGDRIDVTPTIQAESITSAKAVGGNVLLNEKVLIQATRALVLANNGYQAANLAARQAVRFGNLSRPKLVQLQALNISVEGKLAAAARGRDVAVNTAAALNEIALLRNLIGGK